MSVVVTDKSLKQSVAVDERNIVTSSSSLGILREQLVKNIGIERISGFLFQFGWEMGVRDAKKSMKLEISKEELVKKGPLMHIESGHIRGINHTCNIEYDKKGDVQSLVGKGIWVDSYEAEEHIKVFGISESPVCYTLSGYSSGFMSTVFDKPLLARELTCVGAGDEECSWMIMPQEDWEEDNCKDAVHIMNQTPIVKELEYTYDNLLEQARFVTTLADFQKRLTEEVVNGSGLQTLVDSTYEMMKLPVIIEDTQFQTMFHTGLTEEEIQEIQEDTKKNMPDFLVKKNDKYVLPFRKKTIRMSKHDRLVVPIFVQKKVLGYCSFILDENSEGNHKEEYLFLDHLSNAAALILLNAQSAYETFERMKGNFLEQILEEKLSPSELILKGKYIGLDLNQSFYVVIMDYNNRQDSIEEEFNFRETILELANRFFHRKNIKVLAGHRNDQLTLLLFHSGDTQRLITQFKKHMNGLYKGHNLKIGVSGEGKHIENVNKRYEEARIALRLAIRKKIVLFKSLGIIGMLINSDNITGINMVAREELKALFDTEDERMMDLFKTLYHFLTNGGNLNKTKQDLALSMSGLRHRIQKIEEILEKDLRDPEEANQLLLLLNALIVLKELDMS
ncbi:XylR N-terminal domain-containing protein [Pseudalkalibacillus sp. A8]|uniref:XylR N-terminal domain-containing protein n=1 Tax=Pseudalkalibacillus sp. A8 TaxID=3382641 RepID=UPI0038B57675